MTTTEKRNDLKWWHTQRISRVYADNPALGADFLAENIASLDSASDREISKEYKQIFGATTPDTTTQNLETMATLKSLGMA